jgi:hypothetical protein
MSPIFIAGPFLCGLVACIASAILMCALGINNFGKGLVFHLVVRFGYLVASTVNTGINPSIPCSILHDVISRSYFLIAGAIRSLVLVTIQEDPSCALTSRANRPIRL